MQQALPIDEEYLVRNTGRTPAIAFHTECRETYTTDSLEEGPDCEIVARAERMTEVSERKARLAKAGYTPDQVTQALG